MANARGPLRLGLMLICLAPLSAPAAVTPVPDPDPAWNRAAMPARLTLADARRIAFAGNWELLAARSGVDLATAQQVVAAEFPNPTLSLSTAKIDLDAHPAGTRAGNGIWERSYDSSASLNQLLEIGGKRSSRQAAAAAGLQAAHDRLLDARRRLDFEVARAYIAVVQADSNAGILRRSSESLQQEARIAATRLAAGDISRSDRAQIEIAAERFELDALSAATTATTLRIELETLLGSTQPKGDWVAVDSFETLIEAAAPAEPDGPGGPVHTRPDLLAAEADLAKAAADLRLQKALRIPDPTVQFLYEHEPPDQPNTAGLGLSFPLPLWNRNRGAIRSAQAARDQAGSALGRTRAQVAAESESARARYRDAAERWRRYRDRIQPRSDEVRKTVSFAYSQGGAALLDLLTAERNDNDVRLATAQAAADTALAAAALQAALNPPPREPAQP